MTCRKAGIGYNDVLRGMRLPPAKSFDNFIDGGILKDLYKSVDDLELVVGVMGDSRQYIDGTNTPMIMPLLLFISSVLDILFFEMPSEMDLVLDELNPKDRVYLYKRYYQKDETFMKMCAKIYGGEGFHHKNDLTFHESDMFDINVGRHALNWQIYGAET